MTDESLDGGVGGAPAPGQGSPADTGSPVPAGAAWERLEDQLGWYDRKSAHHKKWFYRLKVAQIVIAAAIPASAAAGASAAIAGVMGATIVVFEGLQQLFQFQQNWLTYRATAEALKHEKFLCAAGAGPYAGAGRPSALLAERVEGLVSQEHAAWTSSQKEAGGAGAGHATEGKAELRG
jgi:hypothetical protein